MIFKHAYYRSFKFSTSWPMMGIYAQGQDYLYVSTRVVRSGDAMVLGNADFRIKLDNNMRSLLEGQGGW